MPEKNDFQYKPLSEKEVEDLFPRGQMPLGKRLIQFLFSFAAPLSIGLLTIAMVFLFSFVLSLRQNMKYEFSQWSADYREEKQNMEAEWTRKMASLERQMKALKAEAEKWSDKKIESNPTESSNRVETKVGPLPEMSSVPTDESMSVPVVPKQRIYALSENSILSLRIWFPSLRNRDPFAFFFSVLLDNKAYYWFGMAQGGLWQFDFPDGVRPSTIYLIHSNKTLPDVEYMVAIPYRRENEKAVQVEKLSPLPTASQNPDLQKHVAATQQKIKAPYFPTEDKK